MNLENKRILVTGATGGIGRKLAAQLCDQGCRLAISARNNNQLELLAAELSNSTSSDIFTVAADITHHEQCRSLVNQANRQLGGLDVLINLAGMQTFKPLGAISDKEIVQQVEVNLLAPILLAREASELMIKQNIGQIVNVGSTFGSIAFANFSVYSATKFGLRGFSEALRRELKDTGVSVNYVAPRATLTDMNTDSVYKMAKETGMNFDSPGRVANEIISAIVNDKKSHFIGFPEKIFVRINAVLPNLVDKALYKKTLIARKYV